MAFLAIGHVLATPEDTLNMVRVRQTEDLGSLDDGLRGFTRWHRARTVTDTLTFAANLWSLATVSKPQETARRVGRF